MTRNEITEFKNYQKLINSVAYRVHMRMRQAGVTCIELEDVKQELVIAFCIARDRWDEDVGVPYSSYVTRGMWNHINHWADEEIKKSRSISLDEEIYDGESTNHEIITNVDQISQEDVLISSLNFKEVNDSLSRDAKLALSILQSPPKEIVEEWKSISERAKYGKERGIACAAPRNISLFFIFSFMGLSSSDKNKVYRELVLAAEKVSRG